MTKYREILRLHSMNLSQMNIAASCRVSKKTVNKAVKAANKAGISWPLDDSLTEDVLRQKLFPKAPKPSSTKQMPDFDHIRRELLGTASTRSCYGPNTWRHAGKAAVNL